MVRSQAVVAAVHTRFVAGIPAAADVANTRSVGDIADPQPADKGRRAADRTGPVRDSTPPVLCVRLAKAESRLAGVHEEVRAVVWVMAAVVVGGSTSPRAWNWPLMAS